MDTSFSSLPFYLGCLGVIFLLLWTLHTFFVPYYRTHLKEKVRKWIALSHLDSSGQQIKRDLTDSSYDLLEHIEILENIFGI